MFDESVTVQAKIDIPSNRSFAHTFAIFFCILAALNHSYPLACASLLMFTLGMLAPSLLQPFNLVWSKLGRALGKVTTTLVMLLLFYLLVTPMGLIMRMFRRDQLGLTYDFERESYWINTNDTRHMDMRQQF